MNVLRAGRVEQQRSATPVWFGARLGAACGAFVAAWRSAGRAPEPRQRNDSVTASALRTSRQLPTVRVLADSTPRHLMAIRRARTEALEQHSPAEHASALIAWLQAPGGLGRTGQILARELQVIHAEMCAEIGWQQRPWNPIARELALLLSGGRKTWAWSTSPDGARHRLRTYNVPAPRLPSPTPAAVLRVPAGEQPTPQRLAA